MIGYLKNIQKIFKVFVAYQVQQIRESSDALQWRYIPPKMNPVDYAPRGLTHQAMNKCMFGLMTWIFCESQNFSGLTKHPCSIFKMMILKLEQSSRFM